LEEVMPIMDKNFTIDAVLIIAEIGVNHNGDISLAKKLIKIAKDAGADIAKFQAFRTKDLVTSSAAMAAYQEKNTGNFNTQFDMLMNYEFSAAQFADLFNYCREIGIEFLATAFDDESFQLIQQIGSERIKIPSGEITNLPYLKQIANARKEIILSTGMSTLIEVEEAIEKLEEFGSQRQNITILHCTSSYPAPIEEVNLRAMVKMGDFFGTKIGYSDHTLGTEVAIAAVSLGACIIEKHLTLDRELPGPDHKASLEPAEFQEMVRGIRNIELALGSDIKAPTKSEISTMQSARKSLIAIESIRAGEVFTIHNIGAKRPGGGISPMRWEQYIGRRASQDYTTDDLILE
jgi:N,N'-diacetyllegionaminate synthase